jgi:DNA-binding response OmpR family regulator
VNKGSFVCKVLVVEDNRDLNYVYRIILQKSGYQVAQAYDADGGLRQLASFQPRLVLLDLLMPTKNGVDFLRDAQLTKLHPEVKVVIFTNLDRGNELNAARRYGDFEVAIKAHTPPAALVSLVARLIGATPQAAAD